MFRPKAPPNTMRERHIQTEQVLNQAIKGHGDSKPEPGSGSSPMTSHPSSPPEAKRGSYTTSIFIAGSATGNRHSVSRHDTPSQQTTVKQNGAPSVLQRPASLPNGNVGEHSDKEIRTRLSEISIPDMKSTIHTHASYSHSGKDTDGSITTKNVNKSSGPQVQGHNGSTHPPGKDLTVNGHDQHAPEVADLRHKTNSHHTYNIIPKAPPIGESLFAGRRDIRDPSSVHERQIISAKGTVRGFKNRVRAGIATFWVQTQDPRNYRLLEQGKIVVYATTMSVVRETSERCKIVRSLLQNHMVRYEERDLYMSREIQQELKQRLIQEGVSSVHLPHVFADGIHLGSSEELEKMNEAGELRPLLDNYQKITVRIMCEKCGGYRFVPCDYCHGSKKSLLRNHFTEEFCALRCMNCDENGLRRCDMCIDQQE
ncbi:glutaredoxin domain-containing cysteine-rich protein CG31559-like [Physella acuta]|uniref:glutaredoxin domain-containing cysteine-rich protein CG31559-like n=1 Tax=Physella acuta TaxID=109671 RepID=UPI0027DCFA50|nr:glutaredoxin domain-containing cysteine-rich protein CG31559-like [Physella acuta]